MAGDHWDALGRYLTNRLEAIATATGWMPGKKEVAAQITKRLPPRVGYDTRQVNKALAGGFGMAHWTGHEFAYARAWCDALAGWPGAELTSQELARWRAGFWERVGAHPDLSAAQLARAYEQADPPGRPSRVA